MASIALFCSFRIFASSGMSLTIFRVTMTHRPFGGALFAAKVDCRRPPRIVAEKKRSDWVMVIRLATRPQLLPNRDAPWRRHLESLKRTALPMDIPMTRRKLEEAKFFLGHMERMTRRTHANWDEFGHYLSAFVGAARSVRWVLQAESKDLYNRVCPTWEQWQTPDDRALLRFMNERRLDEVKRTGADVTRDITLISVTDLPHGWGDHGIRWFGPPDVPPPKVGIPAPRFPIEGGGASLDVVPTCRKYMRLLETLVRACEREGP